MAFMLSSSSGFRESGGIESVSPEARLMWLRVTPQLDFTTVKVRILATKLTQLCRDDRSKAVAVHNHVQSLPYALCPQFLTTKASDVARRGHGDCHTKGLLFVALLRALGVPARMRFVASPVGYLNGLIDANCQTMSHTVGEVFLDANWYQTDTYVVDEALAGEVRKVLRMQNRFAGYGLHAMGDRAWLGLSDAYGQRTVADPESLPVVDWGVAHDPAHFYAEKMHAPAHHSQTVRSEWLASAKKINRKLEQIRQRELSWMPQ
jgi:Transglutaminase-like superfamily